MKESLITDFYEQLSMLLASRLPLPESIVQLSSGLWRKDFREALLAVGKETGEGRRLSEAMKCFPLYFHPFQVRMIEKGEENGTLVEILAEIAQSSRFNQRLVATIKEVSIYPLLVIFMGFILFFLILRYVTPEISTVFTDLLEGASLPRLTYGILGLSLFVTHCSVLIWSAILSAAVFFCWLFSGGVRPQRLLASIARRLPLLGPVVNNFMMARVCVLWSILARNKTPEAEIFDIISNLLEDGKLSKAMGRISRNVRDGRGLRESIEEEKGISRFIPLMVTHIPEKELADELQNVAEIHGQMAMVASRKAAVAWEVILCFLMSLTVAIFILAMFLPLLEIVRKLGG